MNKTTLFTLAAVGLCALALILKSSKEIEMRFYMGPSFTHADYQLTLAVDNGDDLAAEVALKNGADPNKLGLGLESYLELVCQDGNLKLAKVLFKYGAKPDIIDADGYTPLMMASQSFKPEMAEVLLEHGANPNIKSHNADKIGAKLGCVEGYTALMIACRGSTSPMVQVLLDHGADPGCVGADGKTALDLAKQCYSTPDREMMIKLLEEKLK